MRWFLAAFWLVVLLLPLGCGNSGDNGGGNKAAIIDQLYLREPNPGFIAAAAGSLEALGFTVDVWQGSQVTVDFYRKLPSMGYRFIVLRVHSGLILEMRDDAVVELPGTFLFTAENYTAGRYVADQLGDKVSYALMEENTPYVFAVNSEFFKSAKGDFKGAVIVVMGCESLKYEDLARVFIDKGASVYFGWSDVVTLQYVDIAVQSLLEKLCLQGMAVAPAVSAVMSESGRDPYYDSFLKYYPPDKGSRTLEDLLAVK